MGSPDSNIEQKSESGSSLHRRETRWQIYFPFILGLVLLVSIALIFVLPNDAIWRVRASAVADWIYSVLCLFPILLCLLPLYLILLAGIYGLNRLHAGTERPLRKLELLSAKLAQRINIVMEYINEKTIQFNTATAPLDDLLSAFDTPVSSEEKESNSDDGTEQRNE